MRWIFDDPAVRRIRHDLRDSVHQRHRDLVIKTTVGVMAATSTFFAGVELLGLGATLLQVTHFQLMGPLLEALALQ